MKTFDERDRLTQINITLRDPDNAALYAVHRAIPEMERRLALARAKAERAQAKLTALEDCYKRLRKRLCFLAEASLASHIDPQVP